MSCKHTWVARKLNYFAFPFVVFSYGFLPVRIPDHEMHEGSYEKCTAAPLLCETLYTDRLLHLLVLSCGQIGEMRSLYQTQLLMEAAFVLAVMSCRDY